MAIRVRVRVRTTNPRIVDLLSFRLPGIIGFVDLLFSLV